MPILIYNKEDQASGNFNSGEILEKKTIGFFQDGGELTLIQIYFIGLMLGLHLQEVLLVYIHIKDLRFVVLLLREV